MKAREYQLKLSDQASDILKGRKIVYLAFEVRTGKTLTSLLTAQKSGFKNVLFLTKKKAISSIQWDYDNYDEGFDFKLTIVNDESMHLIDGDFDLVIHDEHHRCFLGNTKIEGKEIKSIEVGSFQKSYNFVENKYEYKKVLNVFKNELNENLIKIKCNGKEIICTESHEIFTKRGWIKAKDILSTDELQVV